MGKKEKDFKINEIDKYNLDDEIVLNDSMTRYFCEKQADAIEKRDRIKGLIELESAKLSKRIRRNPGKFGLTKPTNDPVAEEVTIQLHKMGLPEKLIKADHRVNLLRGVVGQMNGRGTHLNNLVFLHNSGYFAGKRKRKNKDKEMNKRTKH